MQSPWGCTPSSFSELEKRIHTAEQGPNLNPPGWQDISNVREALLTDNADASMEGVMCETCLSSDESESVVGPRERPVYTIGVAAEILGVHPRTLRIYEQKNLLLPARRANWRYFSERDLMWARGIQYLLHDVGMSVTGLQRVLALIPCWELRCCTEAQRQTCPKATDKRNPCWAVAPRPDNKCYKCSVYQASPAWLLEANELDAIESISASTS